MQKEKWTKPIVVMFMFAAVLVAASGVSSQEKKQKTISIEDFRDRLKGGFIGQMVGVSYGAPFEFRYDGVTVPEDKLKPWQPPMLLNSLVQDDIYVDLTFLEAFQNFGIGMSMQDIGREFGKTKYDLWHANEAARNNILSGVLPPLSGHPRYNSHADDIDFQIEADVIGLISPGLPESARRLAWKTGHVMNYGDGVYGGVFIAAMYSAAYFEDDQEKVVLAGLSAIPAQSNYAKTIADVLSAYRKNPGDWKAAWDLIEKNWGDKAHCPSRRSGNPEKPLGIAANINGAYVAIALLYGRRDPMRTMQIAVKCGRDNDCNTASAMGVLGTMLGFSRLPREFGQSLPMMNGRRFAFTPYDWKHALKAMEAEAEKMVASSGGLKTGEDSPMLVIPEEAPAALTLEQWPYEMDARDVPLPQSE